MLSILYCPECKKNLEEFGELISDFFNIIAENYITYKQPSFLECDKTVETARKFQYVKFLEVRGFVISTECEIDQILILPKGVKCYEGMGGCLCHFCAHPDKHKKNPD